MLANGDNGRLVVAQEIAPPNFIFLQKNFCSNFYRLLRSMDGFGRIKDLTPLLVSKISLALGLSCVVIGSFDAEFNLQHFKTNNVW
jgi:hypothetical protein